MSKGDKFKIVIPILGIMSEDGHRIAVAVPTNAVVEVVSGLIDHDRMVDIEWDGQIVMVFAQDVRDRAQTITS